MSNPPTLKSKTKSSSAKKNEKLNEKNNGSSEIPDQKNESIEASYSRSEIIIKHSTSL